MDFSQYGDRVSVPVAPQLPADIVIIAGVEYHRADMDVHAEHAIKQAFYEAEADRLQAEIARLREGIAALPDYEHIGDGNLMCQQGLIHRGRSLPCTCGADANNARLRALQEG